MITRFKSIKPLAFWVFWKSWICLEYFCSLRKLLTLLADVFCNVKMRCSPKDDECRNPTNRWENVSFPLIPTSPVWPLRYLRGHPCTRVGIGRGPEGGEHLVTFPPPPSPIPKISNLSFFMCGGSSSSFFVMFKNLHYQVGGIRKSCGGAIWISYRPYPLLFPLTEALGLSQETQSPDRQNFSPSALYLG